MNPYEILEVQPSASIDEIKKSYRKLARTHHPDKGGNPVKFQQLAKAYDILSNPVSRERYDTTGETDKPDFSKKFQHFCNEVLMKHFDSIENVEHENPVKVFTKVITETSKHLKDALVQNEKKLRKLQTFLARLKKKNPDNEDLLSFSTNAQINHAQQLISQINMELKFMGDCKEVMDGYIYEYTEQQTRKQFTFSTINFAT